MKILDIGAGSGYLSFPIARKAPGCQVIGLDIVSEALKAAQATADSFGSSIRFPRKKEASAGYEEVLKRLETFSESIVSVYPCHGSCPVSNEIIPRLIEGAEKVERGEIAGEAEEILGNTVAACDIGAAVLLCDG